MVMGVREKMIEILRKPIFPHELVDPIEAVADYLLDSSVTVQEWISVDDRLPEDGVRVLAAYDDGVVRIGICRGYFPAVMSKKYEKAFGFAEVTHWMPLPETPKGE